MSYQKGNGANSSEYEPMINNGSPSGSSGSGGTWKKWIIGGIVVVLVGVIAVMTLHKPSATGKTKAAIEKAGLSVSDDGSLTLFDDLSK